MYPQSLFQQEALDQGGEAILKAPRKVAFLAATEIDTLSGTIRKLCGLDEIQVPVTGYEYMERERVQLVQGLA